MKVQRPRGFSILELLITVTVIAVLLAIAAPIWRSAMRKSYLSSVVNSIVGDMQYARAESATRHQFVSICRSTTGSACDTSGVNYDAGYIVYSYNAAAAGANQAYNASTAGMVLLRVGAAQTNVSVQATDGNIITFGQTGLPIANGTRTALNMVACARAAGAATGTGANSTAAPGARIALGASGSVASTKLAVGAACTAS